MEWELNTSHSGGSRFYFAYTGGPPTAANCSSIAANIVTLYTNNLAKDFSIHNALKHTVVTDLSSSTAATGNADSNVPGTLADPYAGVEVAGCLNSHIPRRYRGGKPRLFLPLGNAVVIGTDGASWTSTFVTQVNGDWVAFKSGIAAMTGVGCTLTNHVNVSYYQGFASVQNPVTKRWENIPTPRSVAIAPDVISLTTLNPTVSQQRRRRFTPIT